MTTARLRTPWQVTRAVWLALFLREFMGRVSADRLAWFWMLFEPIAMMGIMVAIRTVALGGDRHIAGVNFVLWLLVGLLGFFLFRENMVRSIGSIEAGRALYSYRQVKPVDLVLVRGFLEGSLKTFILGLFIAVGTLLGVDAFPGDFMLALFAWMSLWLLGLGVGLVLSALSALVPEIGKIARITNLPLLIISGVIIPMNFLPHDILQYLMWNPILHGLELLRSGFFPNYRPIVGLDATYLWFWVLSLLTLGFMLQIRFEVRLKAL